MDPAGDRPTRPSVAESAAPDAVRAAAGPLATRPAAAPTPALLCPGCGAPFEAADGDGGPACVRCGAGPTLRGRYELHAALGQNVGITYRGFDRVAGCPVVVKELALRRLDAWKTQELFHREIALLRQLRHAQVPAYLDHFTEGAGKAQTEYLVQELVEGRDLRHVLEDERFDERATLDVMEQVLGVLAFLHDRKPPVVHRDIKPSNLIRKPDGSIAVVDFGAAKDLLAPPEGGSTVAGTFGYMAPEQFRGEALPQSDLYALGATAVTLLARTAPEDMLADSLTLDWRAHVQVAPPVAALLDRLLAPDPTDRPPSAEAARELVRATRRALETPPPVAPSRPSTAPAEERPPVDWVAAEPSRERTRGPIVVAVLLVAGLVAVVGALVSKSSQDPSATSAAGAVGDPYASLPVCEPARCEPVPQGLKGLRFGMTVEEATAALPALASGTRSAPARVLPAEADLVLAAMPVIDEGPPGTVVTAPIALGGVPFDCAVEFVVEERLSRIACTLTSLETLAAHEEVERTFVKELRARYGPPGEVENDPPQFEFDIDRVRRSWTWTGPSSELRVRSHFRSYASAAGAALSVLHDTSELAVESVSKRHLAEMERLREAARRRVEDKGKAAQREREERARREVERLRAGRLDGDL